MVASYCCIVVHHKFATGGNYERSNLASGRLVVAFAIATRMKFVHDRNFGRPSCPKCSNLIFSPEASENAGHGCIRHSWPRDDYHSPFFVKVRI
jgi:hypothetical protein